MAASRQREGPRMRLRLILFRLRRRQGALILASLAIVLPKLLHAALPSGGDGPHVVGTVSLDGGANGVAVDPATGYVYVAELVAGAVAVLDGRTSPDHTGPQLVA